MKYIQMKKMVIACVICILHAYGSDDLKMREIAYNAAIEQMFDTVNQTQVAPEVVAGWIVEDHHDEGVEKNELLRRYNIYRYYPQHATASSVLEYGWEGNRDLNADQQRPEKTITVIDNGNFNIYNVTSLGHCGLYAINATRQDVINAANGNDLPIVQKLRAEPGTPLTNGQLVKIGALLHKNVVILYNNEKVISDFDENTEEFYEFSQKNPNWPTYYVFTDGTGHFKVAAPTDDDLLNKYGSWKQAHVKGSEDIEEGNIDYDALDESQTLR